ncbi:putative tetratricopeptide-like helical domain superfamily [Helianthus annuus]|nr:putative tetratricopeptide-like helical domain superfamily [Helianthus annuus]KAJ0888524.1 putative tetratricopeptide-like helical domain superfamily [Helianthus annuus]
MMKMALRSLASKAVRSSSSRVLSTNTRYNLIKSIHSTPVTPEPCIDKLTGPRVPIAHHDRLFMPPLHNSEETSLASTLAALLPALCFGLSLTPVLADDASTEVTATDSIGLQKIEDGSVVSNIHTSKWRVFTDSGRDLFFQGKLEDAERLFIGALEEARQGFGERDPHVASACNNLAELYRVKKAFDKAEPLYLEAINILEESYGLEDIRVGAALHNLGQFYLVQKKLDGASACYERALKIKRRVLGEAHADYAETMYHLGKVLHLQGKGKDAEALIKDSIRILEEGGQGESFLCMRRLHYLVQIYVNSSNLTDAVDMQRKILHTMEVSKGWESLETVIAAERLALILESAGSFTEAKLLLQRCLDSRRKLLRDDNIQIAANMLHMARVELLLCSQTRGNISEATAVFDNTKHLLGNAIRIARQALDKLIKQGANSKSNQLSKTDMYSERTALLILLQALNALSQLEVTKAELHEPVEKEMLRHPEAEKALLDCISAYKHYGIQRSLYNFGDIKGEYLSCLKHLSALLTHSDSNGLKQSGRPSLQEVLNEIKRVEGGSSSSMPNKKP